MQPYLGYDGIEKLNWTECARDRIKDVVDRATCLVDAAAAEPFADDDAAEEEDEDDYDEEGEDEEVEEEEKTKDDPEEADEWITTKTDDDDETAPSASFSGDAGKERQTPLQPPPPASMDPRPGWQGRRGRVMGSGRRW